MARSSWRLSLSLILGGVLAFCIPIQSFAWGWLGHQVIATLAEQQLTPAARGQVQRLLALEPGATLASISTWADENRAPMTARWHYVNLPRGNCVYDAVRDCPDGNCVVRAIQAQIEILKSDAPDPKKLLALKYLVHFVGDVHQPLHAGYADDRGGNQYQVNAFGKGSNLHALWDSGMLMHISADVNTWVGKLSGNRDPMTGHALDPAEMAQESCKLVASKSFYPPHKVSAAYLTDYQHVMEQRLTLAAGRLGKILNNVWR
ncbi:MAG: S1/P1 nuclease [Gammaproteobacteria bacterium]|nr:S1/P1 nuclease [Gammaproteobacteria bacterium]MBU0786833.1 S1/P1 nuclease [Gammaproteobacteria bacterium]MBU0813961.1 S1/P1 nuclease [Gammaproteobacteria bacterium]MBU1788566.1 S1/P1 nuclease [Gammaproteobacteria bacterium]